MRHINFSGDYEIQMNQLIQARRPDIVLINQKKRTCYQVNFAIPADKRVKIKKQNNRRILEPC